jgi:putative addiction module killer protein
MKGNLMNIRYTEDFEKWMKSLKDTVAKGAINLRLKRLSEGNAGDVKPIGDSISEMRIHFGCGYRVYFSQFGNEIIIILCAGAKKSQAQDILKAKELKKCLIKQLLN